jgi:hypothetical protein
MSSSTAVQTSSTPSSDFNSVFDAALSEYKKKTSGGLLEHPLAEQLKRCDSIGAISAILQGQAREFQQFRDGDQRLMKWINPMVDVLFTFSATLGEVASIVCPLNLVLSHLKCILMLLCRRSPLQAPSLRASVYSFLSVLLLPVFVDPSYHRRFIDCKRCESEPRCAGRSV